MYQSVGLYKIVYEVSKAGPRQVQGQVLSALLGSAAVERPARVHLWVWVSLDSSQPHEQPSPTDSTVETPDHNVLITASVSLIIRESTLVH